MQRQLGALQVSALGFGCMGLSGSYGAGDDATSEELIARVLEAGVNFLDTADAYGAGHNEELLGRALKGRREQVVLATKFGLTGMSVDGKPLPVNGKPAYLKSACEASLRRLQTDYIDLYYLHRVDPEVPIEDSVGAMAELVQAGKVRCLGLSEAGAATLRRAHKVHPITALQSEWSLWTRDIESEILSTCRELGIGIVPWSPLGRGFLTATVTSAEQMEQGDARRHHPRFQGDNLHKNLAIVEAFAEIAASQACTPAQLALAWLLAQGDDVVPIPGTRKIGRFQENLGAVQLDLESETLAQIEALFSDTAGKRYPDAQLGMVGL